MSEKEVVVLQTHGLGDNWDGWTPDIVVGIDFGMTYTGVAYSSAPEWLPPKTIQRWPGKLPGELVNKVPTCIEYDDEKVVVKNWGYMCDQEDKSASTKEFFKLHLAPQYHDDYPGCPSRREAQRWFQDYIQCVYKHVISHFNNTIPQFDSRRVEFLFSVPTTWKDVRMVEETRGLLEKAISSKTPLHRVSIGLTEAEAAAVYAGNEHYDVDDTILVCDAGGGTTDVNVLKLISLRGEPTRLEQLGNVEGQPIGSVFIDRKMYQFFCGKLEKVQDRLSLPAHELAWKMISGRFQRLKCAYGTEMTLTPSLKLDVPSLDADVDIPEADIYSGQMVISWDHLKEAFDVKIDEIIHLMDGHLHQMHSKYPEDQISYLVLSGGFGSSPYVKKRLDERYGHASMERHPNTEEMQILVADEPQLVVVHGLVLDRIQQIKRGVVTFGSRCSPVSYGIICDKLYNPERHMGQRVRLDPRDKLTYAIDQIDWLVVRGSPIPITGLKKQFQLKMDPGKENEPWKVSIVMSALAADKLPQNMNHIGVQRVCDLDIVTEGVDRKLKNRHWYNTRPSFWRTKFDVKVVVGPADLSFQLWSKDQRIRSTKHEPISVKWMPAGEFED
ncbi:hypothetical protein N7462_000131 [Penicillium macrosclerotiorum]|uniref:uncharacterized protein n=1 Tax=Penicillium macrosclerotiorum TaxID=303699 RepID=UPI0025469C9C|nr:uncharacterized protein N7462_000131 [Penicillium macrosclerotiorum]KAJ5698126.1 hypothetical protein N7462_000131 [Penicillium macrosclerotiorum]